MPALVLRTTRCNGADRRRQPFAEEVPAHGADQSSLCNVPIQIEFAPDRRQIVDAWRRRVVRRLPVNQDRVPMSRDGQRRQRLVGGQCRSRLRGNARRLRV